MRPQDPGAVIRAARRRAGIGQRALARRAGTTQAQVSRIERGRISPTVDSLQRLLVVMGERLDLGACSAALPNVSSAELRADLTGLTPGERVARAAELSFAATSIAAASPRS